MSATGSFPFTTGRINTWPMPESVTHGVSIIDSLKLDFHRPYLGLYY